MTNQGERLISAFAIRFSVKYIAAMVSGGPNLSIASRVVASVIGAFLELMLSKM
jgi:hypothetical protein